MANPGGTSTAIPVAKIPTLASQQTMELQQHIGRVANSDESTRLLTRLFCVLVAGKMRWNAEQVGDFLGDIPNQDGINAYLNAYNAEGVTGLERQLPGDEKFYAKGGGSR